MSENDGFVYLLHFSKRISSRHTCQHYLGWCKCLAARIQKHRLGCGSRLTAVAHARGIDFQIARVWRGDRKLERRLKNRKAGPRLCPVCSPTSRRALLSSELSRAEIKQELIGF